MSRIYSQTNLQAYRSVEIEALPFSKGWTAVIYWGGNSQSVACVGAPTEAAALNAARANVDFCLSPLTLGAA